jgi:hypothetical protein
MLGLQNITKRQLEEYLIFCYILPSGLLEKYACKEVMGK